MAHGPGLKPAAPARPAVEIALLQKRFAAGQEPLFAQFDLRVAPGEVVALLGPSGIGKSTLLRLIAGIDRAYEGQISVGGKRAEAAPPPGFMFQEARLLPWLSALDNICAAHPGLDAQTARQALARLDMAANGAAFPHQLSGGMQRRVALARALAGNPGLLLLDEPFVWLDSERVEILHRVLADFLASRRPTTLLVSHTLLDAARLADRVLILERRPVRIVHDLVLDIPRHERNSDILRNFVERLSGLFVNSSDNLGRRG